jgi:hypothetical protein
VPAPRTHKPPVNLTGQLKWAERIAHLFDSQFRVPGTKFRFGLDPIINFFPVAGDAAGFMVSAALVITMARHGVSRKVIILMLLNVFIDGVVGAIPLIGQVFDFYYKANNRNIKLLKEHYEEGRHQGSGSGVIVMVCGVLLLFLALFVFLSYKIIVYVSHFF